jgi:hypothetical protein
MALSVVDVYKILPRTNCGDCGYVSCLAFASMVVSERVPLSRCPHLAPETVARYQPELDAQHAAGRWTRRDLAADASVWARERAASMALEDLPARIGGRLTVVNGRPVVVLPYFKTTVHISAEGIRHADGTEAGRWEQVFIYNHIAQGGRRETTGRWKAFQEIPNTVSKIKSMQAHVEAPLRQRFAGHLDELAAAAERIGGRRITDAGESADLSFRFTPLPRVPVVLRFWDGDDEVGLDAEVKLAFDETITEHLDIESILFLGEQLTKMLISPEN